MSNKKSENAALPVGRFAVGEEVQFRNKRGFPYIVIDAVNNQRALRAVNSANLEVALITDIEPYCDLEEESFRLKAEPILAEMARKFKTSPAAAKVQARYLWQQGFRLRDQITVEAYDNSEAHSVRLLVELWRKLAKEAGIRNNDFSEEQIVFRLESGGAPAVENNLWHRCKEITSLMHNVEIDEFLRDVYPDAIKEDYI